jgi:hypothetical protein
VVGFLKHLARHISGKLLVLWDGALIHLSRIVKEYLSNSAAVATGCYSAVSKTGGFSILASDYPKYHRTRVQLFVLKLIF